MSNQDLAAVAAEINLSHRGVEPISNSGPSQTQSSLFRSSSIDCRGVIPIASVRSKSVKEDASKGNSRVLRDLKWRARRVGWRGHNLHARAIAPPVTEHMMTAKVVFATDLRYERDERLVKVSGQC